MQRAPALCGVWGRVLVASLTLACAMRGRLPNIRNFKTAVWSRKKKGKKRRKEGEEGKKGIGPAH